MANDDTIRAQALEWAQRTGDPAFDDWDGFTLWLEQAPDHARAYDATCAAIAEGADLVAASGPANDDAPVAAAVRARPRRFGAGMAVAASIALVAGLWTWQSNTRDLYVVETTAGEMRSVTLDPGTRIDLAGGTRVAFDRKDHRFARLDAGQALFTIRHDAAHPFMVEAGAERLVDIGTVFDVRNAGADFSVAVAEGAVQFNPDDENVRVSPGNVLRRRPGGDYALTPIATAQVGEWRDGRVTFDQSPLEQVAADLTRATGVTFVAAPGAGGRTVSGSVLTEPLRENPAALAGLLGIEVRADGKRWIIGTN